jgi:hypothetical protein
MTRSRQVVCLIGTLLLASSPCRAAGPAPKPAVEPAGGPPYKLTVVLDIAKSRVLTDVFRHQVERELKEGLQAALGELAVVEVQPDHPKLADVRARGLGPALNDWKERSDVKTHFILIDLVNSQYVVQSRQYDGPTAMPGPVVHTDHTADRAFVARVAELLVERDFGFTGTFRSWPRTTDPKNQPQPVKLDLSGAGSGVPLSRWVKKDDVFAVVHTYADGRNPDLVPWALVQIKEAPQDGTKDTDCTGLLFWRYTPPLAAEGVGHAGYRCVKLGATRGPVRLRLLQGKDDKVTGPLQAQLEISRSNFRREESGTITGSSNPVTGIYDSAVYNPNAEPFDRVAFITVRTGNQDRAYLPLAVMDDQFVPVVVNAGTVEQDALSQRFQRWQRQVDDAWLIHVAIFEDIREISQKGGVQREKILERARAGLARMTDDYNRLSSERQEMPGEVSRRPDVKRLDQVLQELKKGQTDLTEFVTKQEKIFTEESRPERRIALAQIVDAGLAEEKGEYGLAIDLYEKALKEIKDPAREEYVEKLKALWATKDEAHAAARRFIYETFPGLDTAGLDREMENASKALAECKRAGDRLSPVKLLQAANTHSSRIKQEADKLTQNNFEGQEKDQQRIGKVSKELAQLIKETVEFLRPKETK